MIGLMLLSLFLCLVTVGAILALLHMLFSRKMRRYDALTATDILNNWQLHLDLLDPAGREQARLTPPAPVLAAMTMLPSQWPSRWPSHVRARGGRG